MSKEADEKMNEVLKNPFEAQTKKGQERTLKYCAWEVLKDYPQGLNVTQIAREIQDRGLRDFSGRKNIPGQVSGDLVRGRDVFWHDSNLKLWWIRPLAPISKDKTKQLVDSLLPRGQELVGHRVAVWWEGEQRYYEGVFRAYDVDADTYAVDYDDGDADQSLKLREYKVEFSGEKISVVTVSQHNLDDTDDDETCTTSQDKGSLNRMEMDINEIDAKNLEQPLKEEFSKNLAENEDNGGQRSVSTISKNSKSEKPIENVGIIGDGMTLNQRKRKNIPHEDMTSGGVGLKKQKKDITEKKSVSEEGKNGISRLSISQKGMSKSGENSKISAENTEHQNHVSNHYDHHQDKKDDNPNNEKGKKQSSPLSPVVRVVEMINVLDLSRRLQPPEDKRPDTKNLTEVGELMSLSELSIELRSLDQTDADMDEVSSAWKPSSYQLETTTTNGKEWEISNVGDKSDHQNNQFLDAVPCYKEVIAGNMESRLLTSLGSSSGHSPSQPSSSEVQRMDGLVSNRRDSLLCSPPVLSRAPRL